ncbi:MAG: pyridoxal-phosphate-dependent aminotransferase family protein [Halanaerobiales bacterium]
MKKPLIMTPGPTSIHEEVRKALSQEITNPDLDERFYEFYKDTCNRIQKVMNTRNDVLILSGEGILGLEAACASLIETGDRVLCLDNGIFGSGFGDFAKMYGAEVVYLKTDYRRGIDVKQLEEFLRKDHNFKFATLVHCETPSGITNSVDKICPVLNQYEIISVVDAVSAIGGEDLMVDDWKMDIVLGGSQKCLSAPPGLTFLSISNNAWERILHREKPIIGFYANLANWKTWYEDKWFPYTQAINDIYGLSTAVDRWLAESNPIQRHQKIADATRFSLKQAGLDLYPLDSYSNSVTSINIPGRIKFVDIYQSMLNDYNIMIAGAFGFLKDKVIRIGHMGENCYEEKVYITLKALDTVLRKLGVQLEAELHKCFVDRI